MLTRRIIPCLDVRDGQVVKGVRFRNHRVVGDIEVLASRYRAQGADELVFYDITASPEGRRVAPSWVSRVAAVLDIPFCVAGGIRGCRDAEIILAAGADKISVNSPALNEPQLIDQLVGEFGSQCIVVGIDSAYDPKSDRYQPQINSGSPNCSLASTRDSLDWVDEVVARGAGEIVVNCVSSDGLRTGYDIQQLCGVRKRCAVPLVASGGAGCLAHFAEVFAQADVDAALAASVFHSGDIAIGDLKNYLALQGIEVRRETSA